MSIATKTGDAGETSLMYGRRVPKSDPRVDAYGCVDELNAALGLVRVTATEAFIADHILAIQKELINVMGELATAPEDLPRYTKDGFELTSAAMVDRLTAAIDDLEKNKLVNFKGWAIPGQHNVVGRAGHCAHHLSASGATCGGSRRKRKRSEPADPALPEPPLRSLLVARAVRREGPAAGRLA